MKLYKLLRQDDTSGSDPILRWGENVTHTLPQINNPQLCTKDVIHAYQSPHLALLLNPIHANYKNPIIWEGEGDIAVDNWGKVGCFRFTTKTKIDLKISPEIQLRFAILCANKVLPLFENKYPKDNRPRIAIETVKKVLAGQADKKAAEAARAARAAAAKPINFIALAEKSFGRHCHDFARAQKEKEETHEL